MATTCTIGLNQRALVLAIIVLIICAISGLQQAHAFEYSGYCFRMCKTGRGGNLCKCSAVHFAGKRQLNDANQVEFKLLPSSENLNMDQNLISEGDVGENVGENWMDDDDWSAKLNRMFGRVPALKEHFRNYMIHSRRRRHTGDAPRRN